MNSSERAAMGQLRSLLAQRPETSSQRRELISALDATLSLFSHELLRDVVIDYVLRALSQPPLDELRFSPPKRWLKELARGREVPQLALVTSLGFGAKDSSARLLSRILAPDRLSRLEHLHLNGWRLDAQCAQALDAHDDAPPLKRLHLEDCACSKAWSEALGRWPGLALVQELTIPSAALTVELAQALASRPALKIEALRLQGPGHSSRSLELLLEADWIRGLRTLELSRLPARTSSPAGDELVFAIAQCEALTGLRELSLKGCAVGPIGAAELGAAPALAGLERLDLSNNATLSDEGIIALACAPYFGLLRELDVSSCAITLEGLALPDELTPWPELVQIDLSDNDLYEPQQWWTGQPDTIFIQHRRLHAHELHDRCFYGRSTLQVICQQL